MNKKTFLILLSIVLLSFCRIDAKEIGPQGWRGTSTELDSLVNDVRDFTADCRQSYLAGEGFLQEIERVVDENTLACPVLYETLVGDLMRLHDDGVRDGRLSSLAAQRLKVIYAARAKRRCAPDMVMVEGSYCIDQYEYPGRLNRAPKGGATWDEARKACAKRRRRLCTGEEWKRACEGPSCFRYQPAPGYSGEKCRVDIRFNVPLDPSTSGAEPACASPYGVGDLYGNLWEWSDESFRGDTRLLHGGAQIADVDTPSCDNVTWTGADDNSPYIGFRCCADPSENPTPAEDEPEPAPTPDPQPAPQTDQAMDTGTQPEEQPAPAEQ